jgi:uncharacterized membrane protein YbhN (UPF0104 family)
VIAYRGYIITLAACVAAEFVLAFGLAALGADADLIVALELIWLCITVVLTLLIGGHFFPEGGDERGE